LPRVILCTHIIRYDTQKFSGFVHHVHFLPLHLQRMKNLFFTIFSLCLLGQVATAQSSAFSLSPTTNYTTAPDSIAVYNSKILVTNLTNVPLTLSWTRVIVELPPAVGTQVCDKLNCYFPNVSTGSFTMDPGATDTFKIVYNNFSAAVGCAYVDLVVKDVNNLADQKTAEFRHTIQSCSSGIDDLPAAQINLYPNPASDYFTLENSNDAAQIRIFDLSGREMVYFAANSTQRYDISALNAGQYFVTFEDAKGRVFQTAPLSKR
jgi:Secretion system C-terminal sorting domain